MLSRNEENLMTVIASVLTCSSRACLSPGSCVKILNADTEGEDEEESAGAALGIPSDKCILFSLLQSLFLFFFPPHDAS